jgi:hypothetical protein
LGFCPLTPPLSQEHDDKPLIRPVSVLSFSNHDSGPMKAILPLLLLMTVLAPLPAHADDDNQHQRVDLDGAIARGEVLPLSEILDTVLPQIKGRIVEIEFEYEKGRPIYELYIINSDGRRLEYEIDARTAEILGLEDED